MKHEHEWKYVSHWKLMDSVMVRRVCECGEREVAEIPPKLWEKDILPELSGHKPCGHISCTDVECFAGRSILTASRE